MNGKLKGKIKEGEKNLGPDLERNSSFGAGSLAELFNFT